MLAPQSAAFLGIAGVCAGGLVAYATVGPRAAKELWAPVLLLGALMGATQYLIAIAGLWNLAAVGAGLAGLAISYPLARRYPGRPLETPALDIGALILALSGYVILVLLILSIQLIPTLRTALGWLEISVEFPPLQTSRGFLTPAETGRKIPLMRHAGTILAYASGISYLLYLRVGRYQSGAGRRILIGTLQRVIAASLGIISMVIMAVLMAHSGMTDILSRGLAEGVGRGFPWVAPWIGALGAFITGSNTNSNVVFTGLQIRTADLLGYSAAIILAGQTSGAAIGSVIAPTKIIVAASTAGILGQEGNIIRKMLAYTIVLIVLISVLTVLSVAYWG